MAVETVQYNRASKAYKSLVQARAFVDGIEFANDSALVVIGIQNVRYKGFTVLMWDSDSESHWQVRETPKCLLL